MKKIFSLFFLFVFGLILAACSSTPTQTSTSKTSAKPKERDVNYPTELPKYDEDAFAIHYTRTDNTYSY